MTTRRPQHVVNPGAGPDAGPVRRGTPLIDRIFSASRDWSKANAARTDQLELAAMLAVLVAVSLAVLVALLAAFAMILTADPLRPLGAGARQADRAELAVPWNRKAVGDGTIHTGGAGTTASRLCEVTFRKKSFVGKSGTPVGAMAFQIFKKAVPRKTDVEKWWSVMVMTHGYDGGVSRGTSS